MANPISQLNVKNRNILLMLLKPPLDNNTSQFVAPTNINNLNSPANGSNFLTYSKQAQQLLLDKNAINSDQTNNIYSVVNILELINVGSIGIEMMGNVAVANTISSAVIYPWHFTTVNISLSGKSYLGSFGEDSRKTTTDNRTGTLTDNVLPTTFRDFETEDLFQEILNVSTTFSSTVSNLTTKKYPVRILIKNNPKGLDDFLGFCTKFDFKETEDSPFILDYNADFVTKPWQALQEQGLLTRAINGVI